MFSLNKCSHLPEKILRTQDFYGVGEEKLCYLSDQRLEMTSVQKDIQTKFRKHSATYIILPLEHVGI